MLSATDLFCGAGGSSSGMEDVAGVRVVRASNHWAKAIEVHNANMPHVEHDTWDISKADPARYPRTDILWASPSCTFWSQARGARQDFTEEATRPTLFDLSDLADVDDEPEPDEAKERSRALMHDVPRFAEYHRYRAVIVENTMPLLKWWHFPKWIARMRAIGYRHKVLTLNSAFAHQLGRPAPQLRDRVYIVFWQERYREPDWDRWLRPSAWCPSCDEVVTALQAPKDPRKPYGAFGAQYVFRCPRSTCRHEVVWPYTLPAAAAIDWMLPGQRIGDRAVPLSPKTMARIEAGLRRYARGIVLEATGHTFERRPGVRAWPIEDPLRTLHTSASKAVACPPLLIPAEGRDGKEALGVHRPLRTQTGRNELGLLTPAGGTWNDEARPVEAPMRARTTREAEAVVVVPLRANNRPKHPSEPLDTFAAAGQHHGLAMLMRNNSGGAEMCTPVCEPGRTITTAGHQSLLTARAGHPLAWSPDVLLAYDTGRFRSLSRPMPTQTTVTGDGVVEVGVDVADCLFRMLEPDEIKAGMGFVPSYILLGSKRDRVRMCGNAVTPPMARDLIAAVAEAVTGDASTAA